jgi:hypothetical protein
LRLLGGEEAGLAFRAAEEQIEALRRAGEVRQKSKA